MNYRYIAVFLLFVSFISITGCSKDPKDVKIDSLTERIQKLQDDNKQCYKKIAYLSEQVGIGKKQYLEEDHMSISKVMLGSGFLLVLIVIIIIIITNRKLSKNKEMYEKEKIELNKKNSEFQKLILDLEYEIKRLKHVLEDGEKNEVSNLLKSLKSERELRKHKIGGLNDK